jgi:ribulose kinase
MAASATATHALLQLITSSATSTSVVLNRGLEACSECEEFPCSQLIQFCYNPVWQHHLTAIENLRRRRAIGTGRWLEEQKKAWSNEWYRKKWLWLQRECEDRLKKSKEE